MVANNSLQKLNYIMAYFIGTLYSVVDHASLVHSLAVNPRQGRFTKISPAIFDLSDLHVAISATKSNVIEGAVS
ncbi:hypothetical protein OK016_06710 [Vibrio chagasii]|nr:hypothetical protein [Vibrio chagasii]